MTKSKPNRLPADNETSQALVVAVLTGDLVSSTKMTDSKLASVLDTLNQVLKEQSQFGLGEYDQYRGDAFQLMLNNATQACRAAILIRLSLLTHKADARISLGLGSVSSPRSRIKSAAGEAFTLSGRGLDSMAKSQRLTIASHNPQFQDQLQLLTRFVDATLTRITATQSSAVYQYLIAEHPSHQDVADTLGCSRVNATKLLNQANYDLIQDFIAYSQQKIGEHFHV